MRAGLCFQATLVFSKCEDGQIPTSLLREEGRMVPDLEGQVRKGARPEKIRPKGT